MPSRLQRASARLSRSSEINIGFRRQTEDTPSIRVSIEQYLFSWYRFCCRISVFSVGSKDRILQSLPSLPSAIFRDLFPSRKFRGAQSIFHNDKKVAHNDLKPKERYL